MKDAFGVAGAGNLLVRHGALIRRLIRHFREAEETGQTFAVTLEPWLPKLEDFSVQLWINRCGSTNLLGFTSFENRGMSFRAIRGASDNLRSLYQSQWGDLHVKIAEALHNEGYFGPCMH